MNYMLCQNKRMWVATCIKENVIQKTTKIFSINYLSGVCSFSELLYLSVSLLDHFMSQILLKGATSEELKKIKNVMQYAVFAAYHLILETSFFADQRVFLTEMNAVREEKSVNVKNEALPLCDNALSSKVPNSSMLSTVSEGFTSSCNGFNVLGTQSIDLPVTLSPESIDSRPVANIKGKQDNKPIFDEKAEKVSDASEIIGFHGVDHNVFVPKSILILVSSQCTTKESVCEQNHISRITCYGNSDVPLGRYLQEILLNQV